MDVFNEVSVWQVSLQGMQDVEEFWVQVCGWFVDNLVGEFVVFKGFGGLGCEYEVFEECWVWNQCLVVVGLICLGWLEEYGGWGFLIVYWVVFYEEYVCVDVLDKVNYFGEELLGLMLIVFGMLQQQWCFLLCICDVIELWCQGYLEFGVGSDLVSVVIIVEFDGDQWVINGQKVWMLLVYLL